MDRSFLILRLLVSRVYRDKKITVKAHCSGFTVILPEKAGNRNNREGAKRLLSISPFYYNLILL